MLTYVHLVAYCNYNVAHLNAALNCRITSLRIRLRSSRLIALLAFPS